MKEYSDMQDLRIQIQFRIYGIVKNELDKRKVNKRVEIIEAIHEIWKELDQNIIKNFVDSMTGRILKLIEMKGDKIEY